jgi:hypothetical protein
LSDLPCKLREIGSHVQRRSDLPRQLCDIVSHHLACLFGRPHGLERAIGDGLHLGPVGDGLRLERPGGEGLVLPGQIDPVRHLSKPTRGFQRLSLGWPKKIIGLREAEQIDSHTDALGMRKPPCGGPF